jgi:hypothetical protein
VVAVIEFCLYCKRCGGSPHRSVVLVAGWAVPVFAAGAGLRTGAAGSAGANRILIHLILLFRRRFLVRTLMLTDEGCEHYSCGEPTRLEVVREVGEGIEFKEVLAAGRLVDDLVLEYPGEVVGDEDGVEPGCESGVDVGTGTVADHPGCADVAGVMTGDGEIGFAMLLG